MTMLTSVGLVISALGGTAKVARITHSNPKALSNWRSQERFPAATYVAIHNALGKMGLVADDKLWAMRGTKRKTRRARR